MVDNLNQFLGRTDRGCLRDRLGRAWRNLALTCRVLCNQVTATVLKNSLWRVIPHSRVPGTTPRGYPGYSDPQKGFLKLWA